MKRVLIAYFAAEAGYRLAQAMLGSKKKPLIEDMKSGMTKLIPGFGFYFSQVHSGADGKVDTWNNDGKKGLVDDYYNQMEALANTGLAVLGDVDVEAMEYIAPRVFRDRDGGELFIPEFRIDARQEELDALYAITENPESAAEQIEIAQEQIDAWEPAWVLETVPEELIEFIASKTVFYATSGISVLRGDMAGKVHFSPRTTMNYNEIFDFMDSEFVDKAALGDNAVDGAIDHGDEVKSPWDIKRIIEANNLFELDIKELEKALPLQRAAKAWSRLLPDNEAIHEEVDRIKERAIKFAAEQRSGNIADEFKGKAAV